METRFHKIVRDRCIYDFPDSGADWRIEELKKGLFDLFIQDQAGTGPSRPQEQAFVHFRDYQDAICGAVIAALVPRYQEDYADRDMRVHGFKDRSRSARTNNRGNRATQRTASV